MHDSEGEATRLLDGKTLILGASGQVGAAMVRYWSAQAGPESVLPAARTPRPDWVELDLLRLQGIADCAALDTHELNAVLCVAGWTWVDGCEDDPERAFQANAHGPAVLAAYARQRGLPFVYYSTDYLFDGTDERPGPYRETDPMHPVNVYGESKRMGEQRVMEAHPNALIVRTAGVFGYDEQGKNFAYQVLRSLVSGQPMRLPADQVSTPAYNADLARATYLLLQHACTGVFHACGPDEMNRLQLAQAIAKHFGFGTELLHGVRTSELAQRAVRPLRAGLDSRKLAAAIPAARMRTVAQALDDCRPQLEAAMRLWRAGTA